MKKVLSIAILFVMVALIASTCVSAVTTTSKTLADDLYRVAKDYGMTAADKAKVEHYLADHEVSDAQAAALVAKTEEITAVMGDVKNYKKLSAEDQKTVVAMVKEAAAVVDLKVTTKDGVVTIVDKDDKVIEKVEIKADGTLAYTGSSVNVVLIVSSVAVLAIAAVVVARRKLVNA